MGELEETKASCPRQRLDEAAPLNLVGPWRTTTRGSINKKPYNREQHKSETIHGSGEKVFAEMSINLQPLVK